MLGIHHEEGQVWLRWLFPRVSPRYISVDTHTFVNQAFSNCRVSTPDGVRNCKADGLQDCQSKSSRTNKGPACHSKYSTQRTQPATAKNTTRSVHRQGRDGTRDRRCRHQQYQHQGRQWTGSCSRRRTTLPVSVGSSQTSTPSIVHKQTTHSGSRRKV